MGQMEGQDAFALRLASGWYLCSIPASVYGRMSSSLNVLLTRVSQNIAIPYPSQASPTDTPQHRLFVWERMHSLPTVRR